MTKENGRKIEKMMEGGGWTDEWKGRCKKEWKGAIEGRIYKKMKRISLRSWTSGQQ